MFRNLFTHAVRPLAAAFLLIFPVVSGVAGASFPLAAEDLVIQPSFDTGRSPVIGTVPVTAVFTNTTVGDAISFTWDYGDGSTETVPDTRPVTHTYTTPNLYHVSLSATDAFGQVYQTAQRNNVYARPAGGTYFEDVTFSSGTSALHQVHPENRLSTLGNGVAWCEVNADGYLDLMVTNNGGANWLFINGGPPGYTFTDQAAPRGVDDPEGMSAGVVCVDYDNDGDQDLFVQNYAPTWAPTLPKERLFQNDGTGHFVDVAEAAGLADGRNGQSSAWADFDQDGLLDVYVVFHTDTDCLCRPTPGADEDRLYHQNPDHTFSNVTHYLTPPESAQGAGFQATWTDFDRDGDLDLYVANEPFLNPQTHNVMWRNDGPGCTGWCFLDVSMNNGTDLVIGDMGLAVADLQNDGNWDIYNSNVGTKVLLRGRPGGQFVDATARAQLTHSTYGLWPSVTWGMAALDFDNDKYLDIFLVAGRMGDGEGEAWLQPDALFHNRGDGNAGVFDDVSVFSGIDNELKGRTAAYADYNQDGAVDLYLSNFGEASFLYRNSLLPGNWIQLELEGRGQVPREPAGALVTVRTPDGVTQMRTVQIGTGFGNGHDLALYFGLGTNTRITRLTISWPDGQATQFRNLSGLNRRWMVIQP